MANSRTLLTVTVFTAALLPAAAQAADFSVATNVRIETSVPGAFILTDPQGASGVLSAASTSQASHAAPDQFAGALASASSEAGALHVYATGSAINDQPAGTQTAANSAGSASASFNDSFLLLADGYSAGTLAYITANVFLDGALFQHEGSGTYLYDQRWQAQVSAGSSGGGGAWSDYQSNFFTCDACGNGGTMGVKAIGFYAVIGYANGVSMSLAVQNGVGMQMGEPGFVSGTMDLGNTFSWAGITGMSVGGQAVMNFSAVSQDTGFDFVAGYAEPSAAVPEPASWALMIAGLGLSGGAMRTRMRRQPGMRFAA